MKVEIGISQLFLMGWLRIYFALQDVVLPKAYITRTIIKIDGVFIKHTQIVSIFWQLMLTNRAKALRSRSVKTTYLFELDNG